MLTAYAPPKSYRLWFEDRTGYLLAKIEGKAASLQASQQYWAEVIAEATRLKPSRIIIWEDFDDMLSLMDTYLLLKDLCRHKQFLYTRIAFVDEHPEQLIRNKVGELIAKNSGFTCCVFTSLPEAEQWAMGH